MYGGERGEGKQGHYWYYNVAIHVLGLFAIVGKRFQHKIFNRGSLKLAAAARATLPL